MAKMTHDVLVKRAMTAIQCVRDDSTAVASIRAGSLMELQAFLFKEVGDFCAANGIQIPGSVHPVAVADCSSEPEPVPDESSESVEDDPEVADPAPEMVDPAPAIETRAQARRRRRAERGEEVQDTVQEG